MKYFIRSKKTSGNAPLYFKVRKGGRNLLINSSVNVDIKSWAKSQQSVPNWQRYCQTSEGEVVSSKLEEIENMLAQMDVEDLNSENIQAGIKRILFKRGFEAYKQGEESESEELARAYNSSILHFYDEFMKGIKSGEILTNERERYRNSSIYTWQSFGKVLKEFVQSEFVSFDDITVTWMDEFTKHLLNKRMMKDTIGKYSSCFQKLCSTATKYGYNNNPVTAKGWATQKAKANEGTNSIYLTDEELNALVAMPLIGEEKQVRDLFFIGCCTCQRFSDYSRINKSMFVFGETATLLTLTQQKTGTTVSIPIVDDRGLNILEEYDYNVPQIRHHRMNELLKRIFHKLSEDVDSLKEQIKNPISAKDRALLDSYAYLRTKKLLTIEEAKYLRKLTKRDKEGSLPIIKDGFCYKEKWMMVGTHTARRSGITNEVIKGILDSRDIMSISGHSSEKIFRQYIRESPKDNALRIAEKIRASLNRIS